MKRASKSSTIPHDKIRLHFLKDPKRALFSLQLAYEEFKKDGEIAPLLDTVRLIAEAQEPS